MYKNRIRAFYSDLSEKKRRVADYYLQNPIEGAFISVGDVSTRLGVDPNTVLQFCQHIGYTGLAEMKQSIQHYLIDEFGRLNDLRAELAEEEKYQLQAVQRHNDQDSLTSVQQAIRNANRVYVLPDGLTSWIAGWIVARLNLKEITSVQVPEESRTTDSFLRMTDKNDLILYVSDSPNIHEKLHRYTQRTKVACLVNNRYNEAIGIADFVLLAPAHDASNHLGLYFLAQRVIGAL